MTPNKKVERLSSGFPDPNEIPDSLLKSKVLDYLADQSCNINSLAENVYRSAKYRYRGQNRETMISRIWVCIDNMISEGLLEQYETRKKVLIKRKASSNDSS